MEFLSFDAPSKTLTLKKAAVPKPKPDEVLIKVAYSGICGTDLHILEVRGAFFWRVGEFVPRRFLRAVNIPRLPHCQCGIFSFFFKRARDSRRVGSARVVPYRVGAPVGVFFFGNFRNFNFSNYF